MLVTRISVSANKGTFKDTSDNSAVLPHYFCPTPECSFKVSSGEMAKISSCFWPRISSHNPLMTDSKSNIWLADSSPQKASGTNPDKLGAGLDPGVVQFSGFLTLIPTLIDTHIVSIWVSIISLFVILNISTSLLISIVNCYPKTRVQITVSIIINSEYLFANVSAW